MRTDYEVYFQQLKTRVNEIGYISLEEKELIAQFHLTCDWILEFECEKYYGPSFTISIIPPKNLDDFSGGYAVWILMRTFEQLTKKSYGTPTIDHQIDFLLKEKEIVFNNQAFYKSKYKKLNISSF